MPSDWYWKDGTPAEFMDAARKLGDYAYKRVALDQLPNGYRVSTVWLGLDHGFGRQGPPLIFESMVFRDFDKGPLDCEDDLDQERYSTEAEALEGHKRLVEKWAAAPGPGAGNGER